MWGRTHFRPSRNLQGAREGIDCRRPTRDDDTATAARYRGHVEGDTMTFTVSRGDEQIGTYTLARGAEPALKKCR